MSSNMLSFFCLLHVNSLLVFFVPVYIFNSLDISPKWNERRGKLFEIIIYQSIIDTEKKKGISKANDSCSARTIKNIYEIEKFI